MNSINFINEEQFSWPICYAWFVIQNMKLTPALVFVKLTIKIFKNH